MAFVHCTTGYQRFWLVVIGTKTVIEHFLEFPLDQNRAGPRLIKRQQFNGIVISLFELNSGRGHGTPQLNSILTDGKQRTIGYHDARCAVTPFP